MALKNISKEQLVTLLEKNSLTTEDRFLIDSFIYPSLVEYCNDLKPNETERVRLLEEKNIYRYMNTVCIVLGLYGKDTLTEVLNMSPFPEIMSDLRREYSGKLLVNNSIVILVKMLLGLGNQGRNIVTPNFEGEMPQKFMSFRNQTAQEWFNHFVTMKIYPLATIYTKMGVDEAKAHLFSSIAYQLYHSNPDKYHVNLHLSMNEVLYAIIDQFLTEWGDAGIMKSDNGEVLSKVL